MSVPATCPYCNALVPANAPVAGDRVMCPRCGEAVGTGPVEPTVTRTETHATGTVNSRPWFVRRPALTVVLVVLIGVGLWVAWANRHHIRSQFGGPAASEKPTVVKPANLPGLGYLPDSTEAVLAVQMPFLLERLGPEANGGPAKALAALGLP